MTQKKGSAKDRTFGLIVGMISFVISGYQYFHGNSFHPWIVSIGLIFILTGLFIPVLIYPFRIVMEFIGRWLGIANTYILLTLIYIILFIPLGMVFKIIGKDTLKLRHEKNAKTYWIETSTKEGSSMRNQF